MILHYERPLAGSGESAGHPLPGSSGLTPLRHPGYEKRTSPRCSLTLFLNQQSIEETSQRAVPLVRQRQDQPAVHPDRGAFFVARVSRHKVPKTPGYRRYALYIRPHKGSLPPSDSPGREQKKEDRFPMWDTVLVHISMPSPQGLGVCDQGGITPARQSPQRPPSSRGARRGRRGLRG